MKWVKLLEPAVIYHTCNVRTILKSLALILLIFLPITAMTGCVGRVETVSETADGSSEKGDINTESGIPGNVTVTESNGSVILSWDTVRHANYYNLYFSRNPGINKSNYTYLLGEKISKIKSQSYEVTGLNNDITYYFVITAVNADSESLSSDEVSATPHTDSVSPASFQDISASAGIQTERLKAFGNPVTGDINNDGYLDIIAPHHGFPPSIYLNNGDETFSNKFHKAVSPRKPLNMTTMGTP